MAHDAGTSLDGIPLSPLPDLPTPFEMLKESQLDKLLAGKSDNPPPDDPPPDDPVLQGIGLYSSPPLTDDGKTTRDDPILGNLLAPDDGLLNARA